MHNFGLALRVGNDQHEAHYRMALTVTRPDVHACIRESLCPRCSFMPSMPSLKARVKIRCSFLGLQPLSCWLSQLLGSLGRKALANAASAACWACCGCHGLSLPSIKLNFMRGELLSILSPSSQGTHGPVHLPARPLRGESGLKAPLPARTALEARDPAGIEA